MKNTYASLIIVLLGMFLFFGGGFYLLYSLSSKRAQEEKRIEEKQTEVQQRIDHSAANAGDESHRADQPQGEQPQGEQPQDKQPQDKQPQGAHPQDEKSGAKKITLSATTEKDPIETKSKSDVLPSIDEPSPESPRSKKRALEAKAETASASMMVSEQTQKKNLEPGAIAADTIVHPEARLSASNTATSSPRSSRKTQRARLRSSSSPLETSPQTQTDEPRVEIGDKPIRPENLRGIFSSLAKYNPSTDEVALSKVKLGQRLFFEKELSARRDLSCNSCHNLETFGVDKRSIADETSGNRNAPSVLNASVHAFQFWDGRAKNLEQQAIAQILNPLEMGIESDKQVIERLQNISGYPEQFARAFPGEESPVSLENIAKAIGAFESTLITRSRFDDYLDGNEDALNEEEKQGLQLFVSVGCASCHNGVAIGGNSFAKLGKEKSYPTSNLGRFEVTKKEADKYFFKVPSLRNVEKTAPYFHDGSISKLKTSIDRMAVFQLGRVLTRNENSKISSFLKSLSGELPAEVVTSIQRSEVAAIN